MVAVQSHVRVQVVTKVVERPFVTLLLHNVDELLQLSASLHQLILRQVAAPLGIPNSLDVIINVTLNHTTIRSVSVRHIHETQFSQ